jgi:hypothetical protein
VESSKYFGRTVTSQNGVLIENSVLRKIFQPKRKEVTGEREIFIMKSFVIFTLNQIHFLFGATATSGPGPPHPRSFYITQ